MAHTGSDNNAGHRQKRSLPPFAAQGRAEYCHIGDGTGISYIRGLKQFTSNISAIITVETFDGGGFGYTQKRFGHAAPRDMRELYPSLADTDPRWRNFCNTASRKESLKASLSGIFFWQR